MSNKLLKCLKGFSVWCGLMGVAFVISTLGLFLLDVSVDLPFWRLALGVILLIVGFKISTYEMKRL